MKKYWLIVNKDTFIWTKGKQGLIYNSEAKICKNFQCSELLGEFIEELQVMENLYRILLSDEQLSKEPFRTFIEQLITSNSAVLIENEKGKNIPVSLVPILKIQNDAYRYKYAQKKYKDESLLSNCIRLVIHLNESQYGNNIYAKQTIYPLKNTGNEICIRELKEFIHSAGTPHYLSEIILVGNVWKHDGYQEILDYFAKYSLPTFIYCNEKDYIENQQNISHEDKMFYYIIKDEYETFEPIADVNYQMIVTSEEEYDKVLGYIYKYPDTAFNVIPIYNGRNKMFFEKFVYISKEDIISMKLSKREVFSHQSINTNHYGTLTITPDGNIYGNLNGKKLGTIKDSLYIVTFREMTEGNSWLRIRDQKPCCDCIYQWLCPSPSNYEWVIGKPNLCHVKP